MFIYGGLNAKTSQSLKFNRFLSFVIIFNLVFLAIQNHGNHNLVSNVLLSLSWIFVGGYIIFNEILLWVTNKPYLSSPKVFENVSINDVYVTSFMIITLTVLTGNSDFIFLSLIPIVKAISCDKMKLAINVFALCTLIICLANIIGWFEMSFLVSSTNVIASKTISFLTVMGTLVYLGKIFMRVVEFTGNKANVLHNMATTDVLTGLINRREFNRRIAEEFSRAKRHKLQLSLALFDIDFFKKINDTYGHNAGDTILRELGQFISNNTRTSDIAARYGGEEFALVLPETSQIEAYELLDRLRQLVADEVFNKSETPIKATISVGVAQMDLSDKAPVDFCERADKALYKAKESGRNRVERASLGLPKIELVYKRKTA